MTSRESEVLAESLRALLLQPLPGKPAQDRMRPPFRKDDEPAEDARLSAVLVPIVCGSGGPSLIFIERAPGGFHGGQIAFPGGQAEEGDGGPVGTALREAREEIGLDPGSVEVLGLLSPLAVVVSRFLVRPVVGLVAGSPALEPNPDEVAAIIEVPLAELGKPGNRCEREVLARGESYLVPCYVFGKTVVWGVTAMMLAELEQLLRQL